MGEEKQQEGEEEGEEGRKEDEDMVSMSKEFKSANNKDIRNRERKERAKGRRHARLRVLSGLA
jgi:hypothetical protein